MSLIKSKAIKYIRNINPFLMNMLEYHRTHQNKGIDFNNCWFLKDIYTDQSNFIVVKKATQCGVSEWLIGRAIDEAIRNRNVLYTLPTEILRTRFVFSRFNKTLEFTDFYQRHQNQIDSKVLKQFNDGIINFIGSNAIAGFTEFVAHTVIMDEIDQCNIDNLEMAIERQSSIKDKKMIKVSNPTIKGFAIDFEYSKSDKKIWQIPCSNCGEWITPDFFKHVLKEVDKNEYIIQDQKWDRLSSRDIFPICHHCKKPYERYAKGEWVKRENKSSVSGYMISKMFSTMVTLRELVDRFNEGLINDRIMERFYNGDLGQAFVSSGAKITIEMLDECVCDFPLETSCKESCVMGCDVGNVLNVVIGKILHEEVMKVKIIYVNELRTKEDIIDLFKRFNIILGVIDSKPEGRLSRGLAATIKQMWMIDYLTESPRDTIDIQRKMYKVDRTTSLDGVKESILTKRLLLPKNAKSIKEFYSQIMASTRVWKENKLSLKEGRYVWVEGGEPDHYFHAINYMMIAKKILVAAMG